MKNTLVQSHGVGWNFGVFIIVLSGVFLWLILLSSWEMCGNAGDCLIIILYEWYGFKLAYDDWC